MGEKRRKKEMKPFYTWNKIKWIILLLFICLIKQNLLLKYSIHLEVILVFIVMVFVSKYDIDISLGQKMNSVYFK